METGTIENRIIKNQLVNIDKLTPFQGKLKALDDKNFNKLRKSMIQEGFSFTVHVWENSGVIYIIDGHQRISVLTQMKKQGFKVPEIPCAFISAGTYRDAKKLVLLAISQYGKIQKDGFQEFVEGEDFDFDDYDFPDLTFDLDGLFGDEKKDGFDESKEDEVPEDAPSRVKRGEVWQLGEHRLMCGDSTNLDDIKLLMKTHKVEMVFTDPPYGVAINNTKGTILNDEDLSCFSKSLPYLKQFSKSDAHIYVFCAAGNMLPPSISEFVKIFQFQNLLPIRCTHENKRGPKGAFKHNYEVCLFGNDNSRGFYKSDKIKVSESTLNDPRYKGDGKISVYPALWDEQRSTEHNLKIVHPTQKNVAMIEFYLEISSKINDSVLDLFLGSGTTLIAAEKTGRKCLGMELDPAYCDIIIKRFEDLTGKKAEKIGGQ